MPALVWVLVGAVVWATSAYGWDAKAGHEGKKGLTIRRANPCDAAVVAGSTRADADARVRFLSDGYTYATQRERATREWLESLDALSFIELVDDLERLRSHAPTPPPPQWAQNLAELQRQLSALLRDPLYLSGRYRLILGTQQGVTRLGTERIGARRDRLAADIAALYSEARSDEAMEDHDPKASPKWYRRVEPAASCDVRQQLELELSTLNMALGLSAPSAPRALNDYLALYRTQPGNFLRRMMLDRGLAHALLTELTAMLPTTDIAAQGAYWSLHRLLWEPQPEGPLMSHREGPGSDFLVGEIDFIDYAGHLDPAARRRWLLALGRPRFDAFLARLQSETSRPPPGFSPAFWAERAGLVLAEMQSIRHDASAYASLPKGPPAGPEHLFMSKAPARYKAAGPGALERREEERKLADAWRAVAKKTFHDTEGSDFAKYLAARSAAPDDIPAFLSAPGVMAKSGQPLLSPTDFPLVSFLWLQKGFPPLTSAAEASDFAASLAALGDWQLPRLRRLLEAIRDNPRLYPWGATPDSIHASAVVALRLLDGAESMRRDSEGFAALVPGLEWSPEEMLDTVGKAELVAFSNYLLHRSFDAHGATQSYGGSAERATAPLRGARLELLLRHGVPAAERAFAEEYWTMAPGELESRLARLSARELVLLLSRMERVRREMNRVLPTGLGFDPDAERPIRVATAWLDARLRDGLRRFRDAHGKNFAQTLQLLEEMRRAGLHRLVDEVHAPPEGVVVPPELANAFSRTLEMYREAWLESRDMIARHPVPPGDAAGPLEHADYLRQLAANWEAWESSHLPKDISDDREREKALANYRKTVGATPTGKFAAGLKSHYEAELKRLITPDLIKTLAPAAHGPGSGPAVDPDLVKAGFPELSAHLAMRDGGHIVRQRWLAWALRQENLKKDAEIRKGLAAGVTEESFRKLLDPVTAKGRALDAELRKALAAQGGDAAAAFSAAEAEARGRLFDDLKGRLPTLTREEFDGQFDVLAVPGETGITFTAAIRPGSELPKRLAREAAATLATSLAQTTKQIYADHAKLADVDVGFLRKHFTVLATSTESGDVGFHLQIREDSPLIALQAGQFLRHRSQYHYGMGLRAVQTNDFSPNTTMERLAWYRQFGETDPSDARKMDIWTTRLDHGLKSGMTDVLYVVPVGSALKGLATLRTMRATMGVVGTVRHLTFEAGKVALKGGAINVVLHTGLKMAAKADEKGSTWGDVLKAGVHSLGKAHEAFVDGAMLAPVLTYTYATIPVVAEGIGRVIEAHDKGKNWTALVELAGLSWPIMTRGWGRGRPHEPPSDTAVGSAGGPVGPTVTPRGPGRFPRRPNGAFAAVPSGPAPRGPGGRFASSSHEPVLAKGPLADLMKLTKSGPSPLELVTPVEPVAPGVSPVGHTGYRRAAHELGVPELTPFQQLALERAHAIGHGEPGRVPGTIAGYFPGHGTNYTNRQLALKLRELQAIDPATGRPAFTREQAHRLMQTGIAGEPLRPIRLTLDAQLALATAPRPVNNQIWNWVRDRQRGRAEMREFPNDGNLHQVYSYRHGATEYVVLARRAPGETLTRLEVRSGTPRQMEILRLELELTTMTPQITRPPLSNARHHVKGRPIAGESFRGGGSMTTPEPPNARRLYEESIPDGRGNWWARDAEGNFHRYSGSDIHWNGATGTPGGERRIRNEDVPSLIRDIYQRRDQLERLRRQEMEES